MNLPLPHQFTLFALDDKTGKFLTSGPYFTQPFYAACLIELTYLTCITWSEDKVRCISPPAPSNRILPWMYDWLKERQGKKISTAYSELAYKSDSLTQHVLDDLIEWEILKRESHKVLWIFNSTRYPELQALHENLIKSRLKNILKGVVEADFKEIALLKLLTSAKLLAELQSSELQGHSLTDKVTSVVDNAHLGDVESKLLKQVDDEIMNLFILFTLIT